MSSMSRQALTQLQLHLLPPPRNITESRAVFRAMEQFGEIDMFKVLRFEDTTKKLTPKAHIIYKHPDSASALLTAGAISVPTTDIVATPSATIFRHTQYITYASISRLVRDESILAQRKVVGRVEVEVEDNLTRFGSDSHMVTSSQTMDMRNRLLNRFTARFVGFNHLAERMRIEEEERKAKEERKIKEKLKIKEAAEKLKTDNERLARGEKVDLSGKSAEALQEDQLITIQSILGSLGGEERTAKQK